MNKIAAPLKLKMRSEAVADLQDGLSQLLKAGALPLQDTERAAALKKLSAERANGTYGAATLKLVKAFQETQELDSTGEVDDATAGKLNAALESLGGAGGIEAAAARRLEGQIVLEEGLPAQNMTLRLYRLGFGGAEKNPQKEVVTDDRGLYSLTYDTGGQPASLEIRAVGAAGTETRLSKIIYDPGQGAMTPVNLVAPKELQPLDTEYKRLANDLISKSHVGKMQKLAGARENDERQDLTVLNQVTGWDARVVALAAHAAALSADPDVGLSQEALYGLFRAGLPTNKLQLAHTSAEDVEKALAKAKEAGIIVLSDQEAGEVKSQFETFSLAERLAMRAPGSHSTYSKLLETSGMSAGAREQFAKLYMDHQGDPAELWDKALAANIPPSDIEALRRQGKLALLTLNNADMTKRLQEDLGDGDPLKLVDDGLFKTERWVAKINLFAGLPAEGSATLTDDEESRLNALIPPAYEGETVEVRRKAYAEDMARKIRLAYPTHVVGRMVEDDTTDALKLGAARLPGAKLLKNAAAKGFKLGQTPLHSFLESMPDLFEGIEPEKIESAKDTVKTLHRVYQITPSNEAMEALLKEGIIAADDVVSMPLNIFLNNYAHKFPSRKEAEMVYRKARQVSAVTYYLFTTARNLAAQAPVAAFSAPKEVRESVRNDLLKHFPTMESLFGSQDYCECEHCRSVLSPAAYLVDLLQFIDPEDTKPAPETSVWGSFLAQWKLTHTEPYEVKYKKPYEALIERRPDLPHILLTCENTNTALPYIDIVNEILEYYVAHGKLEGQAAHDTGNATNAELLAEPQNVIRDAYAPLQQAWYPLTLPFDLWIETVRAFCDYFETPLWRVLEAFRQSDELLVPAQPYDRAAIFVESLGLAPAEYALLTHPELPERWFDLYGYTTARPAIANPTNAGNATVRIPKTDAENFAPGDRCNYFDVSTGNVHEETKTVSAIGLADPATGLVTVMFTGVWKVPPAAGDILLFDALTTLSSAKALSRRLGVTYKELAEIIRSGFVNPKLEQLVILRKLGVSVQDVLLHRRLPNKDLAGKKRDEVSEADKKRFDALTPKDWEELDEVEGMNQRLAALGERFAAFGSNPGTWLERDLPDSALDEILVLADTDNESSFDTTTLRYASGRAADSGAFLKISLFVRLWRKLGWTIEETDRALQEFMPKNSPYTESPFRTVLIYLAHLKALNERVPAGEHSLVKLLTLWSDIPTTGENPLYAQLFLTCGVLKTDDVFDHPSGDYLSPAALHAWAQSRPHDAGADFTLIKGHLLALQGALGLTAQEIDAILKFAKLENADLSLSNVSLLYRFGMLAKALKLTISELIALIQLTGLNPFMQLSPVPLKILAEDVPFTQTVRFVEIAEQVKESGLSIEDLEYLLRHRLNPAGKYRDDKERSKALLKTLAEGIRAIRAEHAMPAEPDGLNDDVLRQKLGLVLPQEVVERFLSMMNRTAEFTATKNEVEEANELKPADFAGEPSISEVSYDKHKRVQKLVYQGVLFENKKYSLEDSFAASPLLAELLDKIQTQAESFFEKYLQQSPSAERPERGFLEKAKFETLCAAMPDGLKEDKQQEWALEQRSQRQTILGQTFMPFLRKRLIRQFVMQTITAQTGAEPAMIETLMTGLRLYDDPNPLLEAFAAAGDPGVQCSFYRLADDASCADLKTIVLADADTALRSKEGIPLRPAGTDSARFKGCLEVPASGPYRLYVGLDKQGAEANLRFDHQPDFLLSGVADRNEAELSGYLDLKAGTPYGFTLDVRKLGDGEARLLVEGETLPKDSLARLPLYPQSVVDRVDHAWLLLKKSLQIIQSLSLSEREVRSFLTSGGGHAYLNLGKLPLRDAEDTPESATELFDGFLGLAGYARLKRDLAGNTDHLIDVFEAIEPELALKTLASLAHRQEAIVEATFGTFAVAPILNDVRAVRRLWERLQIVERLGVPPTAVNEWTGIVGAAMTPDRRFAVARSLKETLKARFDPESWQRVARPIFDNLRKRQRDALVAHVMHRGRFARLEQLYERFLIDPGMEPVVQTSRIRLAIASVQLFIQRCLLNLEMQVPPSVIDAGQWEWMKRYRVWEANRKIFLFPENWLEPEFRDDKSHLFTELEGSLLQGDVSSDLVEDAFLNYLKKLEELARLDIVAMYLESDSNPSKNLLHVIGRTFGQPHKYFYRRYAGQVWTPWEPVTAQIEGDHLAPVVWRNRLCLFWVTFMEKAAKNAAVDADTGATKLTAMTVTTAMTGLKSASKTIDVEVQLHWSEYLKGNWSARQSSPSGVLVANDVGAPLDRKKVFIHVTKEKTTDGEERGVYIHLSDKINKAFYLSGRNSTPQKDMYEPTSALPYPDISVSANRYTGKSPFSVKFNQRIVTEDGKPSVSVEGEPWEILRSPQSKEDTYIIVPCNPPVMSHTSDTIDAATADLSYIASLMTPVFYQDNACTFFVEPSVTERTIEEWEGWVAPTQPEPDLHKPFPWEDVVVQPVIPKPFPPHPFDPRDPVGPFPRTPDSLKEVKPHRDWLVNPGTGLVYDDQLIGAGGRMGVAVLPANEAARVIVADEQRISDAVAADLARGNTLVVTTGTPARDAILASGTGKLNVVGSGGIKTMFEHNFIPHDGRSGFEGELSGGGSIGH